ncbi:MAG: hypothetical protein ACRC28_07650 [Clostridium sp.]
MKVRKALRLGVVLAAGAALVASLVTDKKRKEELNVEEVNIKEEN